MPAVIINFVDKALLFEHLMNRNTDGMSIRNKAMLRIWGLDNKY